MGYNRDGFDFWEDYEERNSDPPATRPKWGANPPKPRNLMSNDLNKPWLAKELLISDHAIDRFRVRAWSKPAAGLSIADLTKAQIEGIFRVNLLEERDSRLILESGAALRWLVPLPRYKCHMIIRPWGAEGPPVVMTVITDQMRDSSFGDGKFKGVQA